ncbi:hypothetical protein [Haloarcula pelagica]|uniref:hypothetical protein n=2 Tax=Haloarcula pelagica TaxID=3033389 RepID=UPI003010515E
MTGGDQVDDSGLDSMLNVLSNRYRRRLLVALLEHNPQEDDDPQAPDDVTYQDENLEELMVQMRHSHLPKLADEGFIEWSRETNAIRSGAPSSKRFDHYWS